MWSILKCLKVLCDTLHRIMVQILKHQRHEHGLLQSMQVHAEPYVKDLKLNMAWQKARRQHERCGTDCGNDAY